MKYLLEIDCCVLQGSIFEQLFLLIYVNDFYVVSKLKKIMSIVGTNSYVSDGEGQLLQKVSQYHQNILKT